MLLVDEQFSFGLVRVSKNKKGTSICYRCICTKSTKCEAVAIVKAREVVEEEVEEDQKFQLIKLSGIHNHPAQVAKIISDTLKVEMACLANKSPDLTAPKIWESVMMEALKKYSEDEMLWTEINMELGADENIDKMIKRMQQKKVGKRPKNRDEFDPSAYVGDEDIIIPPPLASISSPSAGNPSVGGCQ